MDKREEDPSFEQVDVAPSQNFDYDEKPINVKGVDDALLFTVDREPITWTNEEERKLLWKIDLRLIPLVCHRHWSKSSHLLILVPVDAGCVPTSIQRHSELWRSSDLWIDPGLEALRFHKRLSSGLAQVSMEHIDCQSWVYGCVYLPLNSANN
jgi:hypothetical protein